MSDGTHLTTWVTRETKERFAAVARCVAVVGPRETSELGIRRATQLASHLAADGFTVVSGLARGVDTAAHRAAIAAGGYTIGVLGTPITESYPAENRELQQCIADRHLVISQVPIVRYSHQAATIRAGLILGGA
jgi:DNA processing protein